MNLTAAERWSASLLYLLIQMSKPSQEVNPHSLGVQARPKYQTTLDVVVSLCESYLPFPDEYAIYSSMIFGHTHR